jgi:uncharacterized membrane protein YraQ (UPF0718 family)
MKFVVPIPLWLYAIGLLCVVSLFATIGVYVLAAVIVIGFLYFMVKAPLQTIGIVLLLVAFKHWQIALIGGVAIFAIAFVIGLLKPKSEQVQGTEVAPSADAQSTSASVGAVSAEVAEQNSQRES